MDYLDDKVLIKVADKSKCQCSKCIYGLFGGWSNWKCDQYKKGKPDEVLYENKQCDKFKERKDKSFDDFKKGNSLWQQKTLNLKKKNN